ncbi:ABC transporter ATP-binding protein [Methanobacterium alcaliphilum]|uniref:ABC transporter ATP-binding protein n=1 Tax=Methanobacterium alcaliphilum TaxID=392018 RepID=UPI00200AB184|nr:ABC transporter ATP-binding protein [Methanobacterium alcaliphilum]MCK9152133.1 ABC transporter ATP-binding protein/permease [Methanobacterium alcaliphilum]
MNKNKENHGFSRLMELTGKLKILLVLGCILSAIGSLLTLGPFVYIYFIIKEILMVGGNISLVDTGLVIHYGWLALLFAISGIFVTFAALMCTHVVAFKTIKNLRYNLLKHLATLPLGFHTLNPSGKLRKIVETNTLQLEDFIAHRLPDLVGSLVTPIAILILLLYFDWLLGIICLIPLIVGFAIQYAIMKRSSQKFLEIYQNSLGDMNNSAVEYVRGISVVKVFGQTIYSFKNFYDSIIRYKDFVLKYALSMEKSMSLFVTVINGAFFLLIPAGIILSYYATNYESFVLSFIFYAVFAPVTASMLMKIMYTASDQMMVSESLKKIDALFEEKPLKESKNPKIPENNNIGFYDVSFSYASSDEKKKEMALENISFEVDEGKIMALVGPSGGGKTTIANLIPRFWDVYSGEITIGNINIKEIGYSELMDKLSIVFQDVYLFKDSILNNIKFSNPDANREDVLKAARLAQCEDILEKLPHGIDTVIGTKGVYLSGGEKQRISLARAILKDSSIILFDEATAFADPENEHKIQLAFEELTKNKTVIMIAHRLSSIKNVDEILVIKKGKIIEKGNHDELLGNGGLYSNMWREYQLGLSWNVGKQTDNITTDAELINSGKYENVSEEHILNKEKNKEVEPNV